MTANHENAPSSEVMSHFKDNDIGEEHAVHVNMMSTGPEIECLSIFDWGHFRTPESYIEDHGSLSTRIAEPNPELFHVEDRLIHPNAVV